jgi:hypothetical protein
MFLEAYLTLESFFEGENGCVDGILKFHVVVVAFLQESLPVDVILAHCGRFPCKVRTRRITLEQSAIKEKIR